VARLECGLLIRTCGDLRTGQATPARKPWMRNKMSFQNITAVLMIVLCAVVTRASRVCAEAVDPVAADHRPLRSAPIGDVTTPRLSPPGVAIPWNGAVEAALRSFIAQRVTGVSVVFERARRYGTRVRDIFGTFGIPPDMLSLAFVESGFNPHAISPNDAVGIWQLVDSTARRYNIRITPWVDERRDPDKSTQAAARYLADLYRRFKSWPLVLAAYNAGPGLVQRAMREQQTDDVWSLQLPAETQRLVANTLAMMVLWRRPAEYGLAVRPSEPTPIAIMSVTGSTPLRLLTEATDTTIQVLQDLNPELLHAVTPPGQAYALRVPQRAAMAMSGRPSRTRKEAPRSASPEKNTSESNDPEVHTEPIGPTLR